MACELRMVVRLGMAPCLRAGAHPIVAVSVIHASLATSPGRLKGRLWATVRSVTVPRVGCLTTFAPFGTVLDNPIRQGALEADVVSCLFRLNPFMFEDFLPFRLELLIQGGVLE